MISAGPWALFRMFAGVQIVETRLSERFVDLSAVEGIDSAAVAVLLALKRRAADEDKPLRFVGVPAALASLAELYGVEEILGA
jgi:phospholipid transport system transporter-binding protein